MNPKALEVPIIRLELSGMATTIITAFNESQARQDANVRAAVEKYCSEGNVQRVLDAAVREHLDRAIKDEVQRFYSYGEGRELVKRLVQQRLERGETELG